MNAVEPVFCSCSQRSERVVLLEVAPRVWFRSLRQTPTLRCPEHGPALARQRYRRPGDCTTLSQAEAMVRSDALTHFAARYLLGVRA